VFNWNEIYRLVLLVLSRFHLLTCQLIALTKNFRNLFMSYITRAIQSIAEFIVVIITKNNIRLGYITLFYVIFSWCSSNLYRYVFKYLFLNRHWSCKTDWNQSRTLAATMTIVVTCNHESAWDVGTVLTFCKKRSKHHHFRHHTAGKRTNDQRYQICPNSQYYGVRELRRTISRGVRFTNFRLSEGYTTDHKTCNPSRRAVAHLTESISCVPITFDDVSMRK